MKGVLGLFKWLLERDIRTKNATCLLTALVVAALFYFTFSNTAWFQGIEGFGGVGVAVTLLVVLVGTYCAAWLVYSGVASQRQRVASRQRACRDVALKTRIVRRNLDGLTPWQRQFLLRFIVEGRTQIPDFEVGGYRAAWDFEMQVLINKEIVREHRNAGVYEIDRIYYDYLRKH